MGCGSSSVLSARDRRAYHGVAVSPSSPLCGAAAGPSPVSPVSQTTTPRGPRRSQGGAEKGAHDGFHFGVNEALQRHMRRRRLQEWNRTNAAAERGQAGRASVPVPRHDYLTVFGARRLGMIDELSHCVALGSEKSLSVSLTPSLPRTPPSSLTTSDSTVTGQHASVRFDPTVSLHLSETSGAHSPVTHLAGRSWCSFQNTSTSSPGDSQSRERTRRLHGYTVRHCSHGHAHRTRCILFAMQADLVLSCSTTERHMTAYHVTLGAEVGRLVGHDDIILGGAVSPDCNLVATASRDGTVILWELPSCKQRRSLAHSQPVHSCCFSNAGTELATACADGRCRIWTWSTPDVVNTIIAPDTSFGGAHSSLAYTLGDKALVAGGAERIVYVWDRQNFTTPGAAFRQHRGNVLAIDASRTRPDVIMSAEETAVLVWNCATLAVLQRIDVAVCSAVPRRLRGATSAPVRHQLYWTAARMVETRFGVLIAAGASDKCLHLFNCGELSPTAATGKADSTTYPAGAAPSLAAPVELLTLPFSSSVSCIDGGAPTRIAIGDTCGNRYVLELT